jgi:hypothetical protein
MKKKIGKILLLNITEVNGKKKNPDYASNIETYYNEYKKINKMKIKLFFHFNDIECIVISL